MFKIFTEDYGYKLSFSLFLPLPQNLKSVVHSTEYVVCMSKVREMTPLSPVFSPMTQKGFLANFSLPLHPLYRQQQPAAHILTMYSTPNTTMVTISLAMKQKDGVNTGSQKYICCGLCTAHTMIPTRMYKALSELFLNSLMVANTESIRQEKTRRNLKEGTERLLHVHCNMCHL